MNTVNFHIKFQVVRPDRADHNLRDVVDKVYKLFSKKKTTYYQHGNRHPQSCRSLAKKKGKAIKASLFMGRHTNDTARGKPAQVGTSRNIPDISMNYIKYTQTMRFRVALVMFLDKCKHPKYQELHR